MSYPLVTELAADGIPVAVTCRVLKLARQPYYRWLANPVTDREWDQAHLANALFDAHTDDPEFGYRLLGDEAREAGHQACDRTVWRLRAAGGWWSVFGKNRGKNGKKAGPPAHEDLVNRDFTAEAPNALWLTDITEHRTGEGKVYLCAIKDVYSNRIVGYSISDRMKVVPRRECAQLRRRQPRHQRCRRGRVCGPQRPGQSISFPEIPGRAAPPRPGRIHGPGRLRRRQRRHGIVLRAAAEERPGPPPLDHPRRATHRDRDLDRTGPITGADAKPASDV